MCKTFDVLNNCFLFIYHSFEINRWKKNQLFGWFYIKTQNKFNKISYVISNEKFFVTDSQNLKSDHFFSKIHTFMSK